MRQQRRPASNVAVAPLGRVGTEALPAAMLDLHPRTAAQIVECDLDFGRVGAIASQVPLIDQSPRRFPHADLTPLVLHTSLSTLEDASTRACFEHHLQAVLTRERVIRRPPP